MSPDMDITGDQVNINICPIFSGSIKIYHSASVTYYAPNDQSGMHCNIIHTTPSWYNDSACHDYIFVEKGGVDEDGFRGLLVAKVLLFLTFTYR
ncbi:hypothetical protein ID866_8724 [Astraeus odoratus]|nr:hypothetical protein ID866_8724 [Astraeus odoratus]